MTYQEEQENIDLDTNGVEEATALLDGCEAAAETRWAALSDADLDSEIAAFRKGIRDVSNELQALGVAVSIDEPSADAPTGLDDAEVGCPGLAVLAMQGTDALRYRDRILLWISMRLEAASVGAARLASCKGKLAFAPVELCVLLYKCWLLQGDDYTLGNVEDLDPSEWQVRSHAFS